MSESNKTKSNNWNAGLYDNNFSFIWQYGSSLLDLLDPQPGERILDLGCGTGHLTSTIAERGAHVVGIDHSTAMIEQARKSYPDIRFEVADATDFSLGKSFDAVFSNAVLHWVRDVDAVVERIHETLRPGGRFVAELGGHGNIGKIVQATIEVLTESGYPNRERANPWYFPGIAEYTGVLERHGLETTSAALFDRPTLLDRGQQGLALWLEMFGDSFFAGIAAPDLERIIAGVEQRLRSDLFRDGTWYADYRRLRVVALKRMTGVREA